MSVVKSNTLQLGQSLTASQNFCWYQPSSPDGTVRLGNGNAGSVTDLVTINSSGNVGIGTSSISSLGSGLTTVAIQGANGGGLRLYGGSTEYGRFYADSGGSYCQAVGATTPLTFLTNSAVRMTLDSSGNLGLGVTPSSWGASNKALQVSSRTAISELSGYTYFGNNYYIDGVGSKYITTATATQYVQGVGAHYWLTAPSGTAGNAISFTQAMTLDASGNLLVGATSNPTAALIYAYQTGAGPAFNGVNASASFTGTLFYGQTTRAASSAFDMIGCYANSVGQFRASGAGVLYAQNTTVQSISDIRLKENIVDSTDGLGVINALRPVRFDWKQGYGNDRKNQLGFIAQEVEPVFPDAVDEWAKVKEGDDETYKTVGPGALIPVLVKAIQELSAELNELKAKVNA